MFAKIKSGLILLIIPLFLGSCASADGFFSYFKRAPITWNDTKWCVPLRLKTILRLVSQKFGPVRIHSTHRWPAENKRKGGKPKSYHLKCKAVDFAVPGNPRDVITFLKSRSEVGGYAHYPQGFYHIDTGPRRTW